MRADRSVWQLQPKK